MIVDTWKAIPGGEVIDDLEIHAKTEPPVRGSMEEVREMYACEASRIVKAMLNHMPQGLTDAIFAELCRQKASLFVVPQGYAVKGLPCNPASE